jgi:steroid 5-alpha reductase family enzyme
MRNNIKDLLWVGLAYLVAVLVACFCLEHFQDRGLWMSLFYADIAATATVFGFSLLHRNASLYDPYWSVAPPLIVFNASIGGNRAAVILLLVTLWGARLTYNWMRRWRGLSHEDWRYENLRAISGPLYPLVNFFGIHLFPTLMVFTGLLPVLHALRSPEIFWGWIDSAAVVVVLFAIWLEATADKQLSDFSQADPRPEPFLTTGVWAWCRHPNYLGEILFWWGLYLFGAATHAPWWAACAPLAMTAMFFGVSIPMIDKRMAARHPGYQEHIQQKHALWIR